MASEIKVDTISEKTSANGVTIDSLSIKDGGLVAAGNIDVNGNNLVLDANANTYLDAGTDDTIKFYVSGAHDLTISANAINVLSGTTLTIDSGATIANSGTATGFSSADPASADGDTLGTASLEWSDLFLADGGIIKFGNDQEITLTHNADTGLTLNGVMVATTVEPSADTAAGDNAAIGYTSAEGLILTGQGSTDDVTIKNDADTTVLQVATGGVDVEITAGNIIMGTSGKGIDFSATADSGGSMTSELLADYEEGTWTPTAGSDGVNFTEDVQTGFYTKIGRRVFINGVLSTSSIGGNSGNLKFKGFPFTPNTATGNYGHIVVVMAGGLAIADGTMFTIRIENEAVAYGDHWDQADGTSVLQCSEWSDNGNIRFSGSYHV
jgi:hypothetical protein